MKSLLELGSLYLYHPFVFFKVEFVIREFWRSDVNACIKRFYSFGVKTYSHKIRPIF